MKAVGRQNIRRVSLVAVVLAGFAAGLAGCSKSKEPEPPAPLPPAITNQTPAPPRPEAQPLVVPPSPAPPPAATNAAASRPPATPEQVARVATLEKNYQTATGFDNRFDVVIEIGKAGGVEAVQALDRLFRAETDGDLKTELINALMEIGGCKEEKLDLLRLGTGAEQPVSVREAALDGLVDLEDERALPLLKAFLQDDNEKIRSIARSNYDLLQAMLKSQ